MSKNFLNWFGPECYKKNTNEMVAFSSKFPSVLASPLASAEINSLLSKSQTKNSFFFRKIIGILSPYPKDWAGRKDSVMLKDFESQILAAFGKAYR